MSQINVIWWNACRGNWDCGLILQTFENHHDNFVQHNTREIVKCDHAIVVVAGKPTISPLREYLETLKSGLVILTSEEDSYFDWKAAIPSHLEIWTQYYAENKKEITGRMLLGAPHRIKDYKVNIKKEKKYLWSFVGQVQNPYRQACVDALRRQANKGFLQTVQFFGGYGDGGMEYQKYLDILCDSVFAICPSGSMVCDSFRVYEAMECGAIPITDKRCPRDRPDYDYWEEVYPDHDLITVDNWENFDVSIFKTVNRNGWWDIYKKNLNEKLISYASKW